MKHLSHRTIAIIVALLSTLSLALAVISLPHQAYAVDGTDGTSGTNSTSQGSDGDSSLLTFEAKNVRPQGRTAGGMAGIKLAEGARVAAFNVVPAGKVAWTYEEGENGLTSGSGAVVLTVAGDSDALPGTENGAAKVTPLEMYPTKGRATGGVRSQRFLKGQNTLILAWVGLYPLHASTSAGSPVELPKPDMRRDGSGVDLASPIAFIA